MADIPSHHFIYGTLRDYSTGEVIIDTDDERYRQKLARLLVGEKGYDKSELQPRLKIETLFAKSFVVSTIDLVLSVQGKRLLVIRYGPGSLVTRERPALAAARVLESEYVIPFTIVTNGEDAELLDSHSGKVLAYGIDAIPTRTQALAMMQDLDFLPLAAGSQRQMELRILNAYDKEVCCVGGPCALPHAPEG
ncbi:MAG: type I restriction enzyme HsdR N-terminal domain-containing protein [Desulfobulbaceae bacterium]|nr:type I restriction enzyme HsdR N-terminal domain-containing protein [Desulfobulbaceae bacterium]